MKAPVSGADVFLLVAVASPWPCFFYRQNITVILLRFYLPRPQLTIRTDATPV